MLKNMGPEIHMNVSIIIPCRNEEKYIGKCLDSIVQNDYPKEHIEVLVVDGMSEDRTRTIVGEYAEKQTFIKLYENQKRIVPTAMNIGIRNATGEIIIRMDAHSTYEKDYVSKCVRSLRELQADNVGGVWVTLPGDDSIIAQSIAVALSHPFGVGNAHFRIGLKEARLVDTVPFGCYRREVFDRIGLYNEHLVRNQDIELNLRLKKAGGRILLVPDIVSYYHARSTLSDLAKNNFWNGYWVVYSTRFAKLPFSSRHLIPFAFVMTLLGSLGLSLLFGPMLYLFLGVAGSHALANIVFSFSIARERGFSLFPFLVPTFLLLHLSYGLGSLWGIWKRFRGKNVAKKSGSPATEPLL
jgi:glycosyltransferase involved in cell wall biosynthesis